MGRVEIGTGKEVRQEDVLGSKGIRNSEIRRKDGQRKKEGNHENAERDRQK
jgi:hypothetical protein